MPHLFDKYFICEETFKNVIRGSEVIGFQIGIKVSYYRGIILGIIKNIEVTVDGEKYSRDQMTFTVKAGTFTLDEMVGREDVRWDFGEIGYVFVRKPGGLSEGAHTVRVHEEVRIVNGMETPEVIFEAENEKALYLTGSCQIKPDIRRGVSLYSFQDEQYTGKMDVEGMVKKAAEMGANGLEIISEAIIPDFPNPSESWIGYWFSLMEKYNTIPVAYDMFMDGQLLPGVDITDDRAVEILETNIKLAAKLGFKIVRVVYTIPLRIIERALPCAEEYGIVMGIEIHPPFRLKTPQVDQYVDFIKRTGTKNFALIPDFGIFTEKVIPFHEERAIREGADPDTVKWISDYYAKKVPYDEMLIQLNAKEPGEKELSWAKQAYSYAYSDPALLEEYLPYVCHIHAKVLDMRDGIDPSVDNEFIINLLKKNGWSGYICTEYEGQRIFHDQFDIDVNNIGIVEENQKMLERLINA